MTTSPGFPPRVPEKTTEGIAWLGGCRLRPPAVQGRLLEPWSVHSMLMQSDTALASRLQEGVRGSVDKLSEITVSHTYGAKSSRAAQCRIQGSGMELQ